MAKWYRADEDDPEEMERLMNAWPEAPVMNLEVLSMILNIARQDVIDYAPASALVLHEGEPEPVPADRLVLAQLRQAQTLWDAGSVTSGGGVGEGEFTFVPRPLDRVIKLIIRPRKGGPRVF